MSWDSCDVGADADANAYKIRETIPYWISEEQNEPFTVKLADNRI